jgi:hypothetical protein
MHRAKVSTSQLGMGTQRSSQSFGRQARWGFAAIRTIFRIKLKITRCHISNFLVGNVSEWRECRQAGERVRASR